MNLFKMPGLIFRQLFEHRSFTYTYLLGCAKTKQAVLIDPVIETVGRDLSLIDDLGLKLLYAINTHCHADHVTGTGNIKKSRPEVRSAISRASGARADVLLAPGEKIGFGELELEVRATPGHTDGCVSYVSHSEGMVFTGDALLIRGCGRTDFQQGDPSLLYDSVHQQIFTLPKDFIVYPAHDYNGFCQSSVEQEMTKNPRLTKSKDEFIQIMNGLNLAYPKQIDKSLPANLVCGILEDMKPDIRSQVEATL